MSIPPLGHANQGQNTPGRKSLGIVQGLRPETYILRVDKGEEEVPKAQESNSARSSIAHTGHLYPVLHHLGSVLGHHAWVAKAVGHTVELGYGDMDYEFQVFIARLILVGPDGAQALMWAPP